MNTAYIKIGEHTYRRVYPEHVDPKIRTAYKYFHEALKRYAFEKDDDIKVNLKLAIEREKQNLYRVAFGDCEKSSMELFMKKNRLLALPLDLE
jgi:hypothetical protein